MRRVCRHALTCGVRFACHDEIAIIIASVQNFQTALMFAAVLMSSLVGFLLFGMVNVLGWIILHRWYGERP